MVKTCMAYGCAQKFIKGSDISFYSLPKDGDRRRLWLVALRQKLLQVKPFHVLCSKHFKESDFNLEKTGRRTLKPFAIPSIFENKPKKTKRKFARKKKRDKIDEGDEPKNETLPVKATTSPYNFRKRKSAQPEKLSDHTYSSPSTHEKLHVSSKDVDFQEQIDSIRKHLASTTQPKRELKLTDHTYSTKISEELSNETVNKKSDPVEPSLNDHAYARLTAGESNVPPNLKTPQNQSPRHEEHNYSITEPPVKKRNMLVRKKLCKRSVSSIVSNQPHNTKITKPLPLTQHVDHAYLSTTSSSHNSKVTEDSPDESIPLKRSIYSEKIPTGRSLENSENIENLVETSRTVDLRDHTYSKNDKKRSKSRENLKLKSDIGDEKLTVKEVVINRNAEAKLVFDKIIQRNTDVSIIKGSNINKNTDARLVFNTISANKSALVEIEKNPESIEKKPVNKIVKPAKDKIAVVNIAKLRAIPKDITKFEPIEEESRSLSHNVLIKPKSIAPVINLISNAFESNEDRLPAGGPVVPSLTNLVNIESRTKSTKSVSFQSSDVIIPDSIPMLDTDLNKSDVLNELPMLISEQKIPSPLETVEQKMPDKTLNTHTETVSQKPKEPDSITSAKSLDNKIPVLPKSVGKKYEFKNESQEQSSPTCPAKPISLNLIPNSRLYPGGNTNNIKRVTDLGLTTDVVADITECILLAPIKRETVTAEEFKTLKKSLTILEPLVSNNVKDEKGDQANTNLKYVLINPKDLRPDKAEMRMERATLLFEEVFGKKPSDADVELDKGPTIEDADLCCAAQSDDILKRCAVRRRFAQPRYVGDYSAADMGCQRNAVRYYELSKVRMDSQKYIIKKLRTQNSRLSCRFRKLSSDILKMKGIIKPPER